MAVSVDVLAAQPAASMDDIARAAGVVRRTLYGHFPTREALVEAVTDQAIGALIDVMTQARAANQPPAAQYARFMMGAWQLADQHRRLLDIGRTQLGPHGVAAAMRPVSSQVAELAAAAQADGSFDTHLPAAALATVLQSVTFALLDALNADRWNGDPRLAAHVCLVAAGVRPDDAQQIIDSTDQPPTPHDPDPDPE